MLVLYNPPSSAGRKPVLPMSLLSLGALLEGIHDYRIIDGNLSPDPVASLENLFREERGEPVLAVTVMPGPQLDHAVRHCRELKKRLPALTVIWGGYFPTQHFEACLRADYVDYVIRGHGERDFKKLVDGLLGAGPPDRDAIAGLAYRDCATGELRDQGLSKIPEPDRLPSFPYHRVEMTRYLRRTFMGERTLPHHSSYGCPFFCNFCAVVNMVNGRWLAQSAERTARETRSLVENYGADAVEFYDNNFFVNEARTAEFAERIQDLNIAWWGESRIDTLLHYGPKSWELLRRSGLKMVFLGAESGSDETLRRMHKGGSATAAKTLRIVEKLRDYEILPELSFVLGNPPDPASDIRQTIEFIRKVKRLNPRAEIILYLYTPVPLAGDLYDRARQEGFRFPRTLEEWVSPEWSAFSQRRSDEMPWMGSRLRRDVWNFERVLNAYYPTYTDRRLRGAWRLALRAVSAWRYHLRIYGHPLELRALHKLTAYQRPETSGF